MSLSCYIPTHQSQTLQQESGLRDVDFEYQIRDFQSKYGRNPYLDELVGADSAQYIKDKLKLDSHNCTNIKNILNTLGVGSIEEAIVQLNNEFRDQEIDILPLKNDCILYINKRPNEYDVKETESNQFDGNSTVFFNNAIDRLSKLLGVQIIPVTQYDSPLDKTAKGYIYNGNIYINTDNCTKDTALHEMLHLIFGSVKYTNPDLYMSLVSQAQNLKSFNQIAKLYPNRTMNDLQEEVFITELAKQLSGMNSELNNLPDNIKYEIGYNMARVLDTMFTGDASVKVIPNLYNLTWKQVAKILNSPAFNTVDVGLLDNARLSRIAANMKEDLMRKGELKEDCV